MRILIIADCYFPSTKSSAKLIHDLAVECVAQGHQVTVVGLDDTLSKSSQLTVEDGADLLRVRTGRIKGVGRVSEQSNQRDAALSGYVEFM